MHAMPEKNKHAAAASAASDYHDDDLFGGLNVAPAHDEAEPAPASASLI
jgi:hypothetical protein